MIDTNILTALAQGDSKSWEHLQSLGDEDELFTCFIVVGEWEYGIRNAPRSRQAQIRASSAPILSALTGIWESTPETAFQYGRIHAQLRAAGQLIPTNDVWIAATALTHGAVVVSTDPHFYRVPEIEVVNWTE